MVKRLSTMWETWVRSLDREDSLEKEMAKKGGKKDGSRHLCLVPDLRGNVFSFQPLRIMLAVELSYVAFTMLG